MNDETREGSLLPMNPETTNSGGDVKMNSAGKTLSGTQLRLSNNKQKIIPNYLRASTGSCHDFCKYGRNHTFESKEKRPTLRRFSCSRLDTEKEQSKVKGVNAVEKQSKTAEQNASANQKIELSDIPEVFVERALSPVDIVECTETQAVAVYTENHIVDHSSFFPRRCTSSQSSETNECNSPLPSEKIVPLDGFETVKPDTPLERIVLLDDPETIAQKTIPLPEITEIPKYPETTNKKKPSGKKKHLSLEPASVEQRTQSSKRVSASVKPEVRQKAQSPVETSISASLPRVSKKETSFGKRLDASVGSAISGKSRITTPKSISPKNPTAGTARRKNESKGLKGVELSKSCEKKSAKPPSSSLLSQSLLDGDLKSTRSFSPAGHPRKVEKAQLDFDIIKEKTLYVIEPRQIEDRNFQSAESKASSFQLSRSSSSSSLSSILLSSLSVSDWKQDANQEVESVLVEPCSISKHVSGVKAKKGAQQSQRRMTTAHDGDEDPTPYKLKFRRGMVVNPQSDNNGAKRLRFKEGMKLGDARTDKREIERRTFRTKQLAGDLNHPDPEAKIVVLRHQDLQDKKDAPDLLNQIIEETARSSSSSSLSSILLSSPSVSDWKQDANQEVEPVLVEPCLISEHVNGVKAEKGAQQSQRRMTTAHEGDEDPTPYKLKFRRGMVVNPQSDNNGARRLRFKEGMKLGDAQTDKRGIERRSFRRKQLAGDLNHPDPEAKIVVLRHQDVQDKKDAPDLLNQIIEETASKLVKTRKSKVKALVGAFETVISLRDSKPAASV